MEDKLIETKTHLNFEVQIYQSCEDNTFFATWKDLSKKYGTPNLLNQRVTYNSIEDVEQAINEFLVKRKVTELQDKDVFFGYSVNQQQFMMFLESTGKVISKVQASPNPLRVPEFCVILELILLDDYNSGKWENRVA